MDILILEDKKQTATNLEAMLHQASNRNQVVAKLESIREASIWLSKNRPDLIFMDVELSDGLCFSIFDRVKVEAPVIFTTAFQPYTLKVFDQNQIDYLSKPYTESQLQQILTKTNRSKGGLGIHQYLSSLVAVLEQQQGKVPKLSLPTIDGLEFVTINDIVQCQSNGGYTDIFLKDQSKICITKKILEVEQMLSKFPFYRIHRSFLINVNYLKSYKRADGKSYVILDNGIELPVARRKKEDFLKYLSRY